MKEQVVEVTRREHLGKNVSRRLRRDGRIPAILYGADKEPVPISVDPTLITDILHSDAGANSIFRLGLAGTDRTRHVMIKDYQIDPVEGHLIHADFIRIQMDEEVEVDVPIRLTGEAVGVKVDDGILEHVTREIGVTCLPGDIPESFDIDVSNLHVGDVLKVSDLPTSDKYRITNDPGQTLVVISAPVKEEEAAPAAEEVAAEAAPAEPEVVKKGKTETEEEADKESK